MAKLVLDKYSINTLEGHAEFTQRWIKGLRSGNYTQIQDKMADPDIPNSACCLMVAECENGREWEHHFKINEMDGSHAGVAHMPSCLNSEHQWTEHLRATIVDAEGESLTHSPDEWNDTLLLTFEEIADLLQFGVIEYED